MVMLPKPVVPFTPVTVKEIVVVMADWLVVISTLDICGLVMFPLIGRSTVALLSVVACTNVAVGVEVGAGVGVGVGVDVGVGVGVAVAAKVAVMM
jgi:hypothetical protein